MLLNLFYGTFHTCCFLIIAQDADHIAAGYDAELGEQGLEHLQVGVVHSIEHYGVYIFEDYMFLYQVLKRLIVQSY